MTPFEIRCNPIDTRYNIDSRETAKDIVDMATNGKEEIFYQFPYEYIRMAIQFLRTHENGKYATIPHAIELINHPWEKIKPLVWPTLNNTDIIKRSILSDWAVETFPEQLKGQFAHTYITMKRIQDPITYWILSGNDWQETDYQNRPIPMINHPDNLREDKPWISMIPMRLYQRLHGQWKKMNITRCKNPQFTEEERKIAEDNFHKIKNDIKELVNNN